jgi:sortase A
MMRRALRVTGTLLILAGLGVGAWALTVWAWQDPFTALYTAREQHRLATANDERARGFELPASRTGSSSREAVAAAARRYRSRLRAGEPVGRIRIPRMGVDMLVVQGTDHEALKRGPGHYAGSLLPGEGRLVYVAGHRTTYGAPFSRIDRLRRGDRVVLELPYATFEYRVTGHRVVPATAVEVLRPGTHEVLALQACHPRFFASHRYIAYALPVRMTPRVGGSSQPAETVAAA